MTAAAIDALRQIANPKSVVTEDAYPSYLEEWRGRWHGNTPLILAPASTDELSQVMAEAYRNDIPVVPQGGNTGLVGGQIPNGEVLISTSRLREIRDVSAEDFAITVEAGVTLAEAQNAAIDANRLFPLSIGSEGSCQIGGVLSSNAGGVNVIRYGNARDLALGIEVVLPDGQIWDGLTSLRKNNIGYDLKHLFIGGEGTLGIITAATLKLFPRPAEKVTSFISVASAEEAVSLLSLVQERSGGQVTSFELMNAEMIRVVLSSFASLTCPVAEIPAYGCLIEFSSGKGGVLLSTAEETLADAHDRGLILDGMIAQNETQADAVWAIRHNASEGMKRDGSFCVKCDVSVPIREIPAFLKRGEAVVQAHTPGARTIAFGHMGDGNIHFDVLGPKGNAAADWATRAVTLERQIHEVAVGLGGSISAEHGIGVLKRDELAERKSDAEMTMRRSIKAALDPKGLMNPGKLL